MPGPYPETQAQREAAAKKYGMNVEDYEPYPDDGTGYGDYPKLPDIGNDSKDLYEDYDIPEMRRNFGEPVSIIMLLQSKFKYTEASPANLEVITIEVLALTFDIFQRLKCVNLYFSI